MTFFEQEGTSEYESRYAFGDFSAEYKLAKQTILWANGYGYCSGYDSHGNTLFSIYDVQDTWTWTATIARPPAPVMEGITTSGWA